VKVAATAAAAARRSGAQAVRGQDTATLAPWRHTTDHYEDTTITTVTTISTLSLVAEPGVQ